MLNSSTPADDDGAARRFSRYRYQSIYRARPQCRRKAKSIGSKVITQLCWIGLAAMPALVRSTPSSWYKKYPAYPPYCSTPNEMKKRIIPPLADDDVKLGATRLVHVTAVIRHGARTPLSTCWVGSSLETSPWDCNLTTIVTTPSPSEIDRVEGQKSKNPDMKHLSLLEKKYDALLDPKDGLSNTLNGTCEFGQLLLQGYEQELTNGIHFRNAYLFDGESYDHDERMRLINLSTKKPPPFEDPSVRFRSDDDQRTVMSGQVVLQGMFGPELAKSARENGKSPIIPLHTADRDRDVLTLNEKICPRLTELRDQFETTKEFRAFNLSSDAQKLRRFMKKNLGGIMDHEAIDCLMTTICTDRQLPKAIDDYGRKPNRTRRLHHGVDDGDEDEEETETPTETKMFQKIIDFYVKRNAMYITHNDAESSKLGMGPLWAEIMDNINQIVDPSVNNDDAPPPAKFALFSGHDTTIMPLLASLGPRVWDSGEWPPYASMALIEIHEIIDIKTDRNVFKSNFAFRLLYNGKIFTSRLDGCPPDSDLCDVQILAKRVKPFATRLRNCARKTKAFPVSSRPNNYNVTVESTSGHWVMPFIALLSGMALGAILTFIWFRQYQFPMEVDDVEDRISLTNAKELYSDEPESLYGHEARGKTSEFEAAALDATLA